MPQSHIVMSKNENFHLRELGNFIHCVTWLAGAVETSNCFQGNFVKPSEFPLDSKNIDGGRVQFFLPVNLRAAAGTISLDDRAP